MIELDHEFREHKAAIYEFDGGLDRAEAEKRAMAEVEAHRLACEIREILKMDKDKRNQFYLDVRKHRGEAAARELVDQVNAARRGK